MLSRFEGKTGKPLLHRALRDQQCIGNDKAIADAVQKKSILKDFKAGKTLIKHNGSDNALMFILSGTVAIKVHGQELAIRKAGQHVGEMGLLDSGAKRSADVVALEDVVIASIAEKDFTKLAETYPELWRRLAIELASRLRERSKFLRIPNARPVIFIGSSVEGLPVAQEIQLGLSKTYAVPNIWTDDLFIAGHNTMEDLSKAVAAADFGVLVCTPDDKTTNKARKVNQLAPRDNVILELGMCLSALGLHRTLAVIPRTTKVKMPSDLLGVTPIKFTDDDPANLTAHIGPVCTEIRKIVQNEGIR